MPRLLIKTAAAAAALCLLSAPLAQAGVSIAGDTDWKITVNTSLSDSTPAKGATMKANVTNTYTARIMGVPLPVTGYIISSFPYTPFATPTVTGDNCLGTATYSYRTDPYMNKKAWVASGDRFFWGTTTLYVKGSAKADTVSTGYFHGGTGAGHWLDANARDYVSTHS